MSHPVQVITGSRLHFGPLAVGAATGRTFGGIGLMVEQPALQLKVEVSPSDRFTGPDDCRAAALQTLAALRAAAPAHTPGGLHLHLQQAIPRHLGLGSGTQLALAVAQAACGTSVVPATRLARWTGRGARSAVGIYGFEHGGFLVDAGKRDADHIGTLAARVTFPTDWPILLWMPREASGLSGDEERRVFSTLAPMPANLTDRLCGLVLRELLPSIGERQHAHFSHALAEYGRLVGEFFAPVQGGVWSAGQGTDVVRWLQQRGIHGVAQSSWGPTLAIVLPDAATADQVQRDWPFDRAELLCTRARNRGADVTAVTPEAG